MEEPQFEKMSKEEVRATAMEYMKDWNEYAKPVLIEVKKALAEAEAEKPVPNIKDMQKKAAVARRRIIFEDIEEALVVGAITYLWLKVMDMSLSWLVL